MQEPNLKYFSKEEEEAVTQQAMALIEQGKDDEADSLLYSLPMPAEYLQTLKEHMGLEALINEGVNLSRAVEKYGQNWLSS
ncbi:hypothetical protein CE91St38_18140 [Desulfovibrionaceae bacterium]|nr:hypothetical protein CE91St38_18140 [Desulfovibrionaceae bacterium]GKI12358.1 hypothetical protein CE91St39_18120 [Desulfovibrionaceae bacterium]